MTTLKALQAAFQDHLFNDDPTVMDWVTDTEQAPAARRMAIYHNAYRARLVEALGDDFKQLRKLLGEVAFDELCHAYIAAHPSRHFSLCGFGRHMPAFLGYADTAGTHDWHAEMARLEWALAEAFGAADALPVDEAAVAVVPPEAWPGLRIRFHPSLRLLTLWWNTLERWRAAKEGAVVPAPRRLPAPVTCLVWREVLTTQYRSLSAPEAVALRAARAGAGFAEICGALAEELQDQEQVALQAATLLKGWLAAAMVIGLRP